MSTDEKASPEFSQVLFDAIKGQINKMNVHMPCVLQSYDIDTNMAIVQPAFKVLLRGQDSTIEQPLISNVPVEFLKANNAVFRVPLKKGVEGMLVFQQRSIDKWIENGGCVDPEDYRTFSLSDAVFRPGIHSKNNPLKYNSDPDCLEITHENGYLAIDNAGKFAISNGTNELFDLLVQTLTQLSSALNSIATTTVNTALGPSTLNNAAAISTAKGQIDTIKTKLETLKKE